MDRVPFSMHSPEASYSSPQGLHLPEVPPWVFDLLHTEKAPWREMGDHLWSRTLEGPHFDLASVWVRGATDLDAQTFEDHSRAAYLLLAEELHRCRASNPVRLWNFIPHILDPLGELPHRYMVFNAGRFKGYSQWFAVPEEGRDLANFEGRIATASGVGHRGGDLLVHCLAAHRPGSPVENPRQRPAYHYSPVYGPLPPCFARATLLHDTPSGKPWLLVGGTASVLGELTAHGTDLDRQIEETLHNLAALVGAAGDPQQDTEMEQCPQRQRELLGGFRHLRIYYPHQEHRATILQRLGDRFHRVEHLEMIRADLCRPDLLVEIEGLVDAPPGP